MRMGLMAAALTMLAAPGMAAPLCDGRYDGATQMVDAAIGKYGTLYSGGNHWHSLDNVAATLDLLRLWRGKDDAGFRMAERPVTVDMPLFGPLSYAEVVGEALDTVEADTPAPEALAQTALVLDLATALGDTPDWWRQDTPRPDSNSAALVALAAQRPLLDWLQVVLAASDAPWAMGWHLPDLQEGDRTEAFDRLRADALDRARAGHGLEWAVAAQILGRPGAAEDAELRAQAAEWRDKVQDCSASPAEYAAFAVASTAPAAERVDPALLPTRTALWVNRNIAMTMVAKGEPGGLAALGHADHRFAPWLAVARTYAASSLTEIEELHRNRPVNNKSLRALNVLPAAGLQRLALSDAFRGNDRVTLLRAAFTRQMALGNTKDAKRLLNALRRVDPRTYIPALEHRLPEEVAMALAAARLPGLTTLVSSTNPEDFEYDTGISLYEDRYRLELPAEFASGAAVQGDLETWLLLPQRWYRFRAMHGMTWDALDRLNGRGRYSWRVTIAPTPALFAEDSPFGLARLADFAELKRLRGDNGVVRRISETLLPWAEAESSNAVKRLFLHPDLTAEALYRVVRLARHADPEMDDVTPLARRAFVLLHRRFPHSEWTRRARTWRGPLETDCGCRN